MVEGEQHDGSAGCRRHLLSTWHAMTRQQHTAVIDNCTTCYELTIARMATRAQSSRHVNNVHFHRTRPTQPQSDSAARSINTRRASPHCHKTERESCRPSSSSFGHHVGDTHARARVASVARLQNVQLQMERINPKSMRPRSESSGLNPCVCVRGVAHA